MPNRSRRRAGAKRIAGRQRAANVARRLGLAVRDRRLALGLTQQQVASACGLSQSWVSKAERGVGTAGSIETWASLVAAIGGQLVGFVEDAPGAPRPRDHEHLIRQELIIQQALAGAWKGHPEGVLAADTSQGWRYVDVLLERATTRELAVVEIWNLLDDVGDGLRGLATKVQRVRSTRAGWSVSGLLVIRRTVRNRHTVGRLAGVFASALPGSSAAWLRAIRRSDTRMPRANGLIWTDVAATRLIAARLPGTAHASTRDAARVPTP